MGLQSASLACLTAVSFNCVGMFAAEEGATPAAWQPVIEGKIATVSIAKALFEQKEGKYFLAGVRVTNKTEREIGVDLRSRRYCVRINQWTATDTAERTTIDESRVVRAAFSDEDQTSLVKAFRAGKLVRIPAGKSVDYYCQFIGEDRASNRAAVEKLHTKFVILSMDGELRVTDGKQSESLRCGEPGEADVSIERPVPWHTVPRGGRIVSNDSVADEVKTPADANEAADFVLYPAEPSSGWMIRFFPDGSVHAQYGSSLGDAAKLPKGSVHFRALLKAAYRLKSDKQLDRASQISVSLKDETNTAFSLTNDALFRYLIDSFDEKWQPELGGSRFDMLRRQYPIYKDEIPANDTQP